MGLTPSSVTPAAIRSLVLGGLFGPKTKPKGISGASAAGANRRASATSIPAGHR
jgi:hypothetical protein